jgi:hypothetical protein
VGTPPGWLRVQSRALLQARRSSESRFSKRARGDAPSQTARPYGSPSPGPDKRGNLLGAAIVCFERSFLLWTSQAARPSPQEAGICTKIVLTNQTAERHIRQLGRSPMAARRSGADTSTSTIGLQQCSEPLCLLRGAQLRGVWVFAGAPWRLV